MLESNSKIPQPGRINYLKFLQLVVLLGVILYFGRTLFIPLSFALLLSFILYPICKWLERRGMKRWGAIFISLTIVLALVAGIIVLFLHQVKRFGQEWPALQNKLLAAWQNLSSHLLVHYNITDEQQALWLENILMTASTNFLPFLQKTLYASAVSAVLIVLVPFYVALILYYRRQLVTFLFYLFPNTQQHEIISILQQTIVTFYNFIKGMALVYLIVGILNSIGLAILGIPHAILFGIIASLLTFIPYVGITIGSILPMAIAWITYDSAWYPIGVVIVFTIVQYLEANVIFPLAVSFRLQVNTLFTLIAIVAGGILWGASGMILFIPFLGILKLIADRSERLKPLAILLGNNKETQSKPKKDNLVKKFGK